MLSSPMITEPYSSRVMSLIVLRGWSSFCELLVSCDVWISGRVRMSEPERPSKKEEGDQRLHRRPAGNERRRASLREFDCSQVSAVCTCAVKASCFDETSEVGVAEADIVKGSKTQTAAGLSRRRSKSHSGFTRPLICDGVHVCTEARESTVYVLPSQFGINTNH
jgi:hypothetical protein